MVAISLNELKRLPPIKFYGIPKEYPITPRIFYYGTMFIVLYNDKCEVEPLSNAFSLIQYVNKKELYKIAPLYEIL